MSDNKLYVVGGTDYQKAVLTSEALDLKNNLNLSPIRDKRANEVIEGSDDSSWISFGEALPSWHNGSAGLMALQSKLLAFSVYGIDHDKQYSFANQ